MIEIREIKDNELDDVIKIYAQGIEKGKSTFMTEVPTVEYWDKVHLKICRLGAYDGDRLVGWTALQPTSARECYKGVCEVSLYIDDDYQSRGVGKYLMSALITESEKQGIWTLYRAIFSTNTRSIKMCLANGWRIIGTRENIAKDKFGVWQSTTIMERRSKIVGID